MEKKRAKHVRLIGAIYVELLASRTPTTKCFFSCIYEIRLIYSCKV